MVMDIRAKLRRAEEEYRKTHADNKSFRPLRILLKGNAAHEMADFLANDDSLFGGRDLQAFDKPTPDEAFLNGNVCYYKGIPVIAELAEDETLVVE